MTDEEYRLVIGGRTVPGEGRDLSGDQPGPARRGGAGARSASHDQLDQAVAVARAAQAGVVVDGNGGARRVR